MTSSAKRAPLRKTAPENSGGASEGPAVDKDGGPVVDPTANVRALNHAASQRQDDLREASDKFNESQVQHVKEIMALRAEYSNRLEAAESKRIDAIRAVDVNAVAVASERQAAAATVLANQVAQSADALRTLVSNTAATIAEQQRQQSSQITDRITAVERSQYEGRGKELVVDPQLKELADQMKELIQSRAMGEGKGQGLNAAWVYLIGGLGLIGTIGGIIAMVNGFQK